MKSLAFSSGLFLLLGWGLIIYGTIISGHKPHFSDPNNKDCAAYALDPLLTMRGYDIPFFKLSTMLKDKNGTTIGRIVEVCSEIGLDAKGMKISLDDLRSYLLDGCSAVLHVEDDHYIGVRLAENQAGYYLFDLGKITHAGDSVIMKKNWKGACVIIRSKTSLFIKCRPEVVFVGDLNPGEKHGLTVSVLNIGNARCSISAEENDCACLVTSLETRTLEPRFAASAQASLTANEVPGIHVKKISFLAVEEANRTKQFATAFIVYRTR